MATATVRRSPARKPVRKTASSRPDVYQAITDQIIELLEQGVAPWRKPWSATAGMPMSLSTGKAYRGVNVFTLALVAQVKGYQSRWWGTYKQIAERGGQVRKGEKSTQVVYWSTFVKVDEATGEKKVIPSQRIFYVFNADQSEEGLRVPAEKVRPEHEQIAECDELLATYFASGPSLAHGGDQAYYSPGRDHVQMPELNDFESPEEYYGALFHEAVHSTGHSSRLAREGIVEGHVFGDPLYSAEELIAEMGSAMLAGLTGIEAVTLANSAAYLGSWIKVLQGNPKMMVQAAGKAQRAADLILGVSHDVKEDETAQESAA